MDLHKLKSVFKNGSQVCLFTMLLMSCDNAKRHHFKIYTEKEISTLCASLDTSVSQEILSKALHALNANTSIKRRHLLTIVDFTQPSNEQRLYVIDLFQKKILYQTYVAHGQKTGLLKAEHFSNTPNSHRSCLGFVKSGELYLGKHALSLKLDGLEFGKNHLMRKRDIVMHKAEYATKKFIDEHGYLGRSHGCPAIPPEYSDKIVSTIAHGSLLYFHGQEASNNRN